MQKYFPPPCEGCGKTEWKEEVSGKKVVSVIVDQFGEIEEVFLEGDPDSTYVLNDRGYECTNPACGRCEIDTQWSYAFQAYGDKEKIPYEETT